MKKLLFYVAFFSSVVLISSIGMVIAATLEHFRENFPHYFSGNLMIYIVSVILSIWISISLHEIVHTIGYNIYKYRVRLFYVFPLCIVNDQNKKLFSFAFNPYIGIGGIVIPEIPYNNKTFDLKQVNKVKSFSLMIAPIVSFLYGIISLLFFLKMEKYPVNIQPYLFSFLFSNILISAYITLTSLISFGGIIGDFVGYNLMKTNKKFSINQIYNDFCLQEDNTKKVLRNTKTFIYEILSIFNKEEIQEIDSSICSMIDIVIYEWLVSNNHHAHEPKIDSLILKISENNFSLIIEKLRFENYSRLFCHIIIYIYIYLDKTLAKSFWEKNKEFLSVSSFSKYCYNQCERLFDSSIASEKIVISSNDSLLKRIPNYYSDEMVLNKIISDFSNK